MMLPCHILISRKVDAYGTPIVDVIVAFACRLHLDSILAQLMCRSCCLILSASL
jgi:hypothetical protein